MAKVPEAIEVLDLRFFLKLVEHLHFARAGKALGKTQAAASHRLDSLEEKLKVQLFVRARGRQPRSRMQLTAAGRVLLERGPGILLDLENAGEAVRECAQRQATVLVVAYLPALRELVMAAVAAVVRQRSEIEIALLELPHDTDIANGLAGRPETDRIYSLGPNAIGSYRYANELDLGVCRYPADGTGRVRYRELFSLSYRLVVSRRHRLSKAGIITDLSALRGQRFVVLREFAEQVHHYFSEHRFYPDIAVSTVDRSGLLALVRATDLVAILPVLDAELQGLAAISLPEWSPQERVLLGWRGREPPPRAKQLLDALLGLQRAPASQ